MTDHDETAAAPVGVPGAVRRGVAGLRGSSVARAVLPGVILVVAGLVVFFGVLDTVRERDDLSALDEPVLAWLVAHRTDLWTSVLAAITFVSGPTVLPVLVLVGAVVWGLVRREWWRPVLLVGAMVGSTLLGLAVKDLVGRPRPPVDTMYIPGAETTSSFPSGHTLGTATLLLVTGYLVCSRHPTRGRIVAWCVAAVVGTSVVALSRLYLGYHFLTDVVAAVALAVVVLGVVSIVDRLHTRRLLLRVSRGGDGGGEPGGDGDRDGDRDGDPQARRP